MAEGASAAGRGGGEGKRGSRRRQWNLPALVYLFCAAALLSLTMNVVMFCRFHPLYKSGFLGSQGSPVGAPAEMGEAAPETVLLSPGIFSSDGSLLGGKRCPQKDGVEGVCLAVEEEEAEEQQQVKSTPSNVPKHIAVTAAAAAATTGGVDEDSIVINLDHGDPTMYESFWKRKDEMGDVAISGWQTMSYFSDGSGLCWFMEPKLTQEIVRLHRLVGNAKTDGRHIVVGSGSTQLFQAALYALSPPETTQPVSVVSEAPYYSFYPAVTDYLRSGLYRWAGDACAFHGDAPYIEVVCSPNNPDGVLRQAILNKEKGKTIHDLAYYWPQYTAIIGEASHEIMLFTFSKLTGHAGTRIGWALVKDRDVATRMTKFIELNTIGVSKDSQLRAAQILGAISDGYELASPIKAKGFFDYGRRLMTERWERLREAVRITGSFSLPEFPSVDCKFTREMSELHPAFAWLKCEKEDVEDCEDFLKRHKIITRGGKHFGWEPRYVRVSMLDRDEKFDLFIKRILSIR